MPAPSNQEQLLELLDSTPPESHLPIIQAYLRNVTDPEQRRFVQTLLLTSQELGHEEPKKQIVAVLHGIRSPAIWQERLRSKLKVVAPKIEVVPMGYGRYPLPDFLGLRGSREEPINWIRAQLEYLRIENPDAEISVLAHSFGTYIMSEILKSTSNIRIHRLLLCGSIIRENYEWHDVKRDGRIAGAIANDYGTRDYWPVMASKFKKLGYGASGFYGFKHVAVTDNAHDYGHSDFFTDEHLVKYWVPFLSDGQVTLSEWNENRDNYANFRRMKGCAYLGSVAFMALIGWMIFRIF